MKKIIAVLASFAMAFSLTACGGNSSSSSKTFNFSSPLAVASLDSTLSDDGMSFNAMHAALDGLMGVDKDGKITGAIAKSYTVSDDGLTYTFKLRNTTWSNGAKVTADDFVYAWQRIINKAGNYAYMFGSQGANIKNADALMEKQAAGGLTQADLDTLGVKAVNDTTLEVTLESQVQYFKELMTFPCYYPINRAFAEKQGDQYGKKASAFLSNGAFTLTKWELGSKLTYKKNKNYWNAKNVSLERLTLTQVGDVKTGVTGYESGTLDFAELSSDLVNKYKNDKAYSTFPEGYLYYLNVNFKNNALANANIRKAISYAINREDIAKNVLKDGSKAAAGFVPRGLATNPDNSSKDFRDDAATYTAYNLTKAQEYFDAGLKELGVSSVNLRLTYGTDEAPMDSVATYLQNAFTKIKGLNITMVATTKKDRIYTKQANGDFDICLTRWGPDYSDPTTYLNLMIASNVNNYGKYNSSAYDNLMNQVNTESNLAKRWQLMIDAEKVAMDDYANIPLIEKGGSILKRTTVKNLVFKAVGVRYTFNYVTIE